MVHDLKETELDVPFCTASVTTDSFTGMIVDDSRYIVSVTTDSRTLVTEKKI